MTNIKLVKIGGIDIKMHITFPLILVYAAVQFGFLSQSGFSVSGALFGVVATLILFICVLIHELSHSLTAQRMGFPVREIVLLPLGGVAQIERMPEQPAQEFIMAVVGPLSNIVIAGILVLAALPLQMNVGQGLLDLVTNPTRLGWADLLPYLIVTNLTLAVFNLIPAFPMDGGRVLRALLSTFMPASNATALAVGIGQALAWLLGLSGLLTGNFLWILVAVFVYAGAAQEGRMVQVKSILEGLRVHHAFSRRALALTPDAPISHAADLMFESFQSDFPVCSGGSSEDGGLTCQEGRIVGLLTYGDILRALRQQGPDTPVRDVMRSEFPTVGLDDELVDIYAQMAESRVDALPVMDGDRFLGLLTRHDVNEVYQLLSVSPELLQQRRLA
jgi:stage IV sporulation protein FB